MSVTSNPEKKHKETIKKKKKNTNRVYQYVDKQTEHYTVQTAYCAVFLFFTLVWTDKLHSNIGPNFCTL